MPTWFARFLSQPRALGITVVIGMTLGLPALFTGLVGDDYLWWLILQGRQPLSGELHPLLHLYNFIPGGVDLEVLKGAGIVAWWADPELSIALLRPVSVLTHLLDHALGPRSFALQHLHSLLWYGASIVVVGLLYRRIGKGALAMAGLATLMFAVEDAHAMNLAWLANRHALISLVLGVITVLLHLRWRRGGGMGWLAAALVFMVTGLFSGEATLGALAYLVAWELTLAPPGWKRRALAISPYAIGVLAWRLLYNCMGYGIRGSDVYIDPGHDPLEFFVALMQRWPVLQLGQWLQAPIDVVVFIPAIQLVALGISLLVCAALLWYFWPLLRLSVEARFWALGMSAALIPLCAAFPMDRLLIFAGIGALALLALQVRALGWLGDEAWLPPSRPRAWLTVVLLVLHLPLAALLLPARSAFVYFFGISFASGAATAPADPAIEEQTLLFVTGNEFPVAYTTIIRSARDEPTPERVAMLSSFGTDNRVTREDADTLLIEPEIGFLASSFDRLERSLDRPFYVGETIRMPDFDAEVRSVTEDGRPQIVAFHFRERLESPRYRWVVWGQKGATPFTLPAAGETVTVEAAPISSLLAELGR